jgi:hypothetical protein
MVGCLRPAGNGHHRRASSTLPVMQDAPPVSQVEGQPAGLRSGPGNHREPQSATGLSALGRESGVVGPGAGAIPCGSDATLRRCGKTTRGTRFHALRYEARSPRRCAYHGIALLFASPGSASHPSPACGTSRRGSRFPALSEIAQRFVAAVGPLSFRAFCVGSVRCVSPNSFRRAPAGPVGSLASYFAPRSFRAAPARDDRPGLGRRRTR